MSDVKSHFLLFGTIGIFIWFCEKSAPSCMLRYSDGGGSRSRVGACLYGQVHCFRVSTLLIIGSVHTKALYRVLCADHCVMVNIVFLRWANPSEVFIETCPVFHDPRILDNVYKDVLRPLLDAVVRFCMAAGVHNIVAKTRYSPVPAHAAIIHASKIDWTVPDCPGWYSYDYRTADACVVPPTHRGFRDLPGSKPRAREGVTVSDVIDIKEWFAEMEESGRKRLADVLTAPVDKVLPVVPPNAEGVSPVAGSSVAARDVKKVFDVVSDKDS